MSLFSKRRGLTRLPSDPDVVFHASEEEHELTSRTEQAEILSEAQTHGAGALSGEFGIAILLGKRHLRHFLRQNPTILASVVGGVVLAAACFAFSYWLAQQIFECPHWAVDCRVQQSAKYFVQHLGQVQGFVSTIFGIGIAMIAYATYELAETLLWPILTRDALRLKDIERFLAASRGSLPTWPAALWAARRYQHFLLLSVVGLIAILLQVNSIFVGHVFTLLDLPTRLLSAQANGGGFGFGFYQISPGPAAMPASVGQAYSVYTSWANSMSTEPLPKYRDYVMDRSNLSAIGNFSVNAVEIVKKVNCSGKSVEILEDVNSEAIFTVAANLTYYPEVWVRFMPQLAVWVHNYTTLTSARAVVQLMFLAINGTIEGGIFAPPTKNMADWWLSPPNSPWTGMTSLACDVDVELVDRRICVGQSELCSNQSANATLSSTAELALPGDDAKTAVWMGAAPSCFGGSILGTQSMFRPGTDTTNASSYALPIAYTSLISGLDTSDHYWTEATLRNYINVSIGALAMVIPMGGSLANQTVVSYLATPRLDTDRTYVLLAPIGIALASVLVVHALSEWMYQSSGIAVVRSGDTTEIMRSSQGAGIEAAMTEHSDARKGDRPKLTEVRVRYDVHAQCLGTVRPAVGS